MTSLNRLYQILLLAVVISSSTMACLSTDVPGADRTSPITFDGEATVRQIMAFGDNDVILEARVNGGSIQTFTFNRLSSSVEASLAGIRLNSSNDLKLIWYERLNGYQIAISKQQQQFVADGNTVINAPHSYAEFDYDNDGINNYDEREAGSCVWWSTPTCESDVPPEDLFEQVVDVDASDNVLMDGTFDSVSSNWWTSGENERFVDGAFCFDTTIFGPNPENHSIYYRPYIALQPNARYTVTGNVDAELSSIGFATFQRPPPSYQLLHQQQIVLAAGRQNITASFDNYEEGDAQLVFHMGTGIANTFCFDNMKLKVESL